MTILQKGSSIQRKDLYSFVIDITTSLFGMTVYDRLEPLQRFVNPMSREN